MTLCESRNKSGTQIRPITLTHHCVPSHTEMSNLIWNGPLRVKVYITTKQKPDLSLVNAKRIKHVELGMGPVSLDWKPHIADADIITFILLRRLSTKFHEYDSPTEAPSWSLLNPVTVYCNATQTLYTKVCLTKLYGDSLVKKKKKKHIQVWR